ncbi:hypothetical protein VNO77_02410 [Canavalia gladiata]|uniref:Uncharacterized protein n=1 Tax=Canavalia gladiata TaxID=3824 RepID=A0AAN9MTM9_CANGL
MAARTTSHLASPFHSLLVSSSSPFLVETPQVIAFTHPKSNSDRTHLIISSATISLSPTVAPSFSSSHRLSNPNALLGWREKGRKEKRGMERFSTPFVCA